MSEALNYLYVIFDNFLDLMFNQFYMFTGVSVGWVAVTVMIFGLVIRSILNVPKSVQFPRNMRAYYQGDKKNGR